MNITTLKYLIMIINLCVCVAGDGEGLWTAPKQICEAGWGCYAKCVSLQDSWLPRLLPVWRQCERVSLWRLWKGQLPHLSGNYFMSWFEEIQEN